MKVGELKEELEKALKQGKVTESDEVIIVGEYGLGMSTCGASASEVAETDEEILREKVDAFIIDVPTYVYESEDVGFCHMYMYSEVLDEYREFFEEKDEEEE